MNRLKHHILALFLLILGAFTLNAQLSGPGFPRPHAPNNHAIEIEDSVLLAWSAYASADFYQIQIDTQNSFVSPTIYSVGGTDTILIFSNPGTYFWRVRADSAGVPLAWSYVYRFIRFDIASQSPPFAWYDADTGLVQATSPGRVDTWYDRSNNANHAYILNSSKRPFIQSQEPKLNQRPALDFRGDQFLNLPFVTTGFPGLTVLAAVKSDRKDNFGMVWGSFKNGVPAQGGMVMRTHTTGKWQFGGVTNGVFILSGPDNDTSASSMHSVKIRQDSVVEYSLNSVFQDSGQGVAPDGIDYNIRIGWSGLANASQYFDGRIAELIFFDDELSDSMLMLGEAYLQRKYNPGLELGPDQYLSGSLCDIQIMASAGFERYLWSNGDTGIQTSVSQTGFYTIEAQGNLGFVATDTIFTYFPEPPHQLSDTFICAGDSLWWSPISYPNNYQFLWSTGDTSESISITQGGSYWVVVTDSFGCQFISDTVSVFADQYPQTMSLGPDTSFCAGNRIGLVAGGDSTVSYLWSDGSSDSVLAISSSGSYWVQGVNLNGCRAADSIAVNISGQAPLVSFSADTVCLGDSTSFIDQTTVPGGGSITQWFWQFGDGDSSVIGSPDHLYHSEGTYSVRLTATSDSGCEGVGSGNVLVNPLPVASFRSFPATPACPGKDLQFFDQSSITGNDSIIAFKWLFGDGDSSILQNPIHAYSNAGSFQIRLEVASSNGCSNDTSINISVDTNIALPEPFGIFRPSELEVFSDSLIDVKWDLSENASYYILEWSADSGFGSGVGRSTPLQVPEFTVVVDSPGTFYVRVWAHNSCFDSLKSNTRSFCYLDPGQISGIILHLCSDTGLSIDISGRVSSWQDLSGNNNNAGQSSASARPAFSAVSAGFLNRNTVSFDGQNDYLQLPFSTSSLDEITILSVARSSNYSFGPIIGVFNGGQTNSGLLLRQTSTGYYQFRELIGGIALNSANLTDTSYLALLSASIDSHGNAQLFENQILQDSDTGGMANQATDNLQIGWSKFSAASQYLNGEISDLMVLNRAISPEERRLIEKYLMQKSSPPFSLGRNRNQEAICDSVLDAGPGYKSYLWSTGETSRSILALANGTYSVTVTDAFGLQKSDTIKVLFPNQLELIPDSVICLGDSLLLDAGSFPGYSFSWSTGDTSNSIWVNTEGAYFAQISNSQGCRRIIDTVNIGIDSFKNILSLGPDTAICGGSPFSVSTGDAQIASYVWSTGDTGSTIRVNSPGNLWLNAISSNGCAGVDSVNISFSGYIPQAGFTTDTTCQGSPNSFTDLSQSLGGDTIRQWHWDFVGFGSDTVQNPEFDFGQAGDFQVTLTVTTDSGCTDTATGTATVYASPAAVFNLAIFCVDADKTLSSFSAIQAPDSIVSYTWLLDGSMVSNADSFNFNPADTGRGSIELIVTSNRGCADTARQNYEVFPGLEPDFTYQQACLGELTQFIDVSNSFSIISRLWDMGDGNSYIGETVSHLYGSPGDYEVTMTVTNAIGCVDVAVDTISVNIPPQANFQSDTICAGQYLPLEDQSISSQDSIRQWQWFVDGSLASTMPLDSVLITDTGIGYLSLVVITEGGCSDTLGKDYSVLPLPMADFSFSPSFGSAPISISFSNNSQMADSFYWDFGDGGFSNDENPSYIYSANGTYNIQLEAISPGGCTDIHLESLSLNVPDIDLAVEDIRFSDRGLGNGSLARSITVRLVNLASTPINYADLVILYGAEQRIQEQFTDLLLPGQFKDFSFATELILSNPEEIEATCIRGENVNNGGELILENNTVCATGSQTLQIIGPYPNPVIDQLNIDFISPSDATADIRFFNSLGQLVYEQTNFPLTEGFNPFDLNVVSWGAGNYYMEVLFKGEKLKKKFQRR